ncbi:hypothetical protein ACNQKP_16860 [Bdellovibrio bacteriovorus]|uniref:hypothetical protein n=1 Tax=Bdellovibrio bacteriovorus TaxID=959 RepID=UPI003AA95480
MKQFSKALLATAIVFTASPSFAGYDEFDCRSSGNFSTNTHLQCVSCGAQKYFANKAGGREVVPSEKWLLLLGTVAVQNYELSDRGGNNLASDFDARKNYQKYVISMMRSYGFCQSYISKERSKTKRSAQDSDVAPSDWSSKIYPGLTRDTNLGPKGVQAVGKYYGFDDSSWFGWQAGENMNYLLTGSPDPRKSMKDAEFGKEYPLYPNMSFSDKRTKFKERLSHAFPSEYDVSGEKKKDSKQLVASGDKSNGLRECLQEINRMQHGQGDPLLNSFMKNVPEGEAFCKSMANACDIELDFCTGSKGTKSVTQPEVFRSNSRPQPPPPPMQPSRSGSGYK